MISTTALLGVIFTIIIAIGLPIGLLIALKGKTGKGLFAALIGAACFFVFALVLEQLLHILVLPRIMNIPWLYCVYGCLAAGLFEETGRLVGLSFLCKKDRSLATGLGYGIGHGGIEAILTAGIASIANLSFILSYNAGTSSAALETTAQSMKAMPGYYFWLGGIERISAIAVHIALSVLIWMVVTKRLPVIFYIVSIFLHALTNASAAMMQAGLLTNVLVVEAIVFVTVVCICAFVVWQYRRTAAPAALAADALAPAPQENAPQEDAF